MIIKVACHISGRKLAVLWGEKETSARFCLGEDVNQNKTKQSQKQNRGKLIEAVLATSILTMDKTVC